MSLSCEQIDDYIAGLLANAADLVHEADILLNAKAFARSYGLAHLAREEIAKSMMLHAAGCRLIAGAEVDWRDLSRRLRDHRAKLRLENVQNAMIMAALGGEEEAKQSLAFAAHAADYRNDRKNAAFYVSHDEGELKRPAEEFTEAQARRTVTLAKLALSQQQAVVQKLGRFSERPKGQLRQLEEEEIDPEKMLRLAGNLGPVFRKIFGEQSHEVEQEKTDKGMKPTH